MIWLVFALLTGAAVLSVLAPLAGKSASPARGASASDIAFFEEQIAEIDRELAEGRLEAADAETARAEAARRLLRARGAPGPGATGSRKNVLIAALAALVLLPSIALPLYLRLGRSDLPDMPLAARMEAAPGKTDLAGAVARIEAHLQEHPEDGRGFEVVAPYYARTGRFDDAVHAYAEALRLLGPAAMRHASLGEAQMQAARGVLTKEARQHFEAAAALEPTHPMAMYYLGLAAAQDGDKAKAEEIWTKLAAGAPPGALYVKAVQARLDELRGAPAAEAQTPPASEQGKAISALPAQQREAAIRSMVERLAGKLEQNGGDVEGWLRLIRAYSVLAESEMAKAALENARKALADKPAEAERVEALAKELNIGG